MKKICFFVGYYPFYKGGAEYQAYLLSRLINNTYNIVFISYDHDEEDIVRDNNVVIYKLKVPVIFKKKKVFFLQRKRIINILNSEKPDVIYIRNINSALGIITAGYKENGSKVIWHVSSESHLKHIEIKLSRWIFIDLIEEFWIRYGISHVPDIICQTDFQKHYVRKKNRQCRLQVIRNYHEQAHRKIVKKKKKMVLWIANYKQQKQPEIFINLAREFENRDDVEFIMIGRLLNGKTENLYNERHDNVKNLKKYGEIPNDEVNSILSMSHILVNTSVYEGFPNTFIQAWMREVVVVSLNVDPDNILTNSGIGFCSRSYSQMVRDVEYLLRNEDQRKEMAKRSRIYAEKEFNIRENTEKLINAFG